MSVLGLLSADRNGNVVGREASKVREAAGELPLTGALLLHCALDVRGRLPSHSGAETLEVSVLFHQLVKEDPGAKAAIALDAKFWWQNGL